MKRRNTETSSEIIALLKGSATALNHEMIQERTSVAMDRATIYRVLNRLWEDRVVHRIVGDDGKQYFALCSKCQESSHRHNHFHFRCTKCGKMECLDDEVNLALPVGYVPQSLNGVIAGVCASCA